MPWAILLIVALIFFSVGLILENGMFTASTWSDGCGTTTAPVTDEQLLREAHFFHQALFRRPVDPLLASRYVAANRAVLSRPDPAQLAAVTRVVELGLDPVAVQFALRFRVSHHLLTVKLRMLAYLAETGEGYFDQFVNTRAYRFAAWCALLSAPPRSALLLAKGYLLVLRHRLA